MNVLPFQVMCPPQSFLLLLFFSMYQLSWSKKLLGSQDLVAVAKLLNLPYKPYFMPHLPLLPSFETRKLFGLPPLPNQLNSAMNSITVTESPPTAPSRTTLAPLLRLLTLTPFTLPPPPKIDSYGINTIPELPPQHESIYVGMFAPDGSLIKKNETTVQETKKQTETNEIYSKEEFVRKTHGRGTREAASIPILSDQTIHDDLHLDDDENVLSELEESKNLANFLRQNAQKAEDFSQQTTELAETTGTIPSPDEATTASTFRLASLNTDAAFSSSENAGTKVKVTTLTRLPIFISRESDPFMMKHRKLLAFHGEGDNNMLQRISPQPRNNLPLRMLPIRSMSHRCLTERNDQLRNECKLKSYNLNRTTMQPTKITYTMNQKVKEENAAKAFGPVNHNVRYAKNLPLKIEIKRAEQFLSDSATDLDSPQQMQSKNAAREKPRIELNSTPSPDEFTQQYDDESITVEVERTIPHLRDGELNRKPRPVTNEMFTQVGNEDVRPTNVLPIAKALPQEIPATQAVVVQSVTSKLAPQQQQQQRVLSWTQTTGPQFLVTSTPSRVQHLPVIQHYYQNAYYKQQQFPARDPQDEMYLRELEEYDHLWSAEHARATSYFHPVIPASLPTYQQYSQAGSDGAALQQVNRAVSRTDPYVQQQQQPLQSSLSSIRLQLRNVTYLSTPAPQFYNSINSLSRVYSTNHQSLQQPSDVQSTFVKKPLPNPFAIKLGPLLQNFAGGLFGNQPQI